MSHKVMPDIKVDDIVGRKRKPVDGVVDPDEKRCEAGYMDEGEIQPLTSELYTKTHSRGVR